MEDIVEIIVAAVIFVGLVGILIDLIFYKKSISARSIQLIAVVFIIPTILILSMENFFDSEEVGILFGAIIGFILSGVGRDETNLKS